MNQEERPIIQMHNIEKHFGSVIALSGVSIDLFSGECHCLLGDNGAGKSTFIKTMSGVYKPQMVISCLKANRCISTILGMRLKLE